MAMESAFLSDISHVRDDIRVVVKIDIRVVVKTDRSFSWEIIHYNSIRIIVLSILQYLLFSLCFRL